MRYVFMNVFVAALAVSLVSCQDDGDWVGGDEVGSSSQAILGGLNEPIKFRESCAMEVPLPPDEDGNAQDPIVCTCTLVEKDASGNAATIITAANCVAENKKANTLGLINVHFGASISAPDETFGVTAVELQRYFNADLGSQNDIAMVRIDGAPSANFPVATLRETPLSSSDAGKDVFLVGYGATADDGSGGGGRRSVKVPLRVVDRLHIFAGSETETTCVGDSGGPTYLETSVGSGVFELIAVGVRQFNTCFDNVRRLRVDAYGPDFIFPFIDRFEGSCTIDGVCETSGCRSPDPDCDDCTWGNTCKEDCPTRDFDCELGKFVGQDCAINGDCEEKGRCIAAHDDAARTYCSRPCVVGEAGQCPSGLVCSDSGGVAECVFDPAAPSPGAQGTECTNVAQCRSGICEEGICVDECDPADAAACDNAFGDFNCGPSQTASGKNVCLGIVKSGGGGFCSPDRPCCAIVPAGSSTGTWLATMALMALALLSIRARRRRR